MNLYQRCTDINNYLYNCRSMGQPQAADIYNMILCLFENEHIAINQSEFEDIFSFLGPNGRFMNYLKTQLFPYRFAVTNDIKLDIKLPHLRRNQVSNNVMLTFTCFDLYFFKFGEFIGKISLNSQQNATIYDSCCSLYLNLLTVYLSHFLPLDQLSDLEINPLIPNSEQSTNFILIIIDQYMKTQEKTMYDHVLRITKTISCFQQRIIRSVIKHSRYYINQGPHHIVDMNQVDTIINTKLYDYLLDGFKNWSLNSTFAEGVEIWLTFIQPWRYINKSSVKTTIRDYLDYFVTNIDFYSLLFNQVLSRFQYQTHINICQLDILYRICVVFNIEDIRDTIIEAENLILPTNAPSQLFNQDVFNKANHIMRVVSEMCVKSQASKESFISNMSKSFTSVKTNNQSDNSCDLFLDCYEYNALNQNSRDDVINRLKFIEDKLCKFFELDALSLSLSDISITSHCTTPSPAPETYDGSRLTFKGRQQVLSGERSFTSMNHQVQGRSDDIERLSATKDEFQCLVTIFYGISVIINYQISDWLQTTNNGSFSSDVISRFTRWRCNRVWLSLRPLAKKSTLFKTTFVMIAISLVTGFNLITSILIMSFVSITLASLATVLQRMK